ncbi:MAG: SWIM zinc finger family protein, partial [Desulfobacula sp.]|nr:SWIM zinc finger family protein [Desulfobacula sp.]
AEDDKSCTCGDYAKNHKKDPAFVCKHILAVENSVPENDIEPAKFLDKNTPKLKDGFLKNIKGKDFVLYAGVLDLATQKGLLKLEVELLQFPTKENGNEAICRAVAEDKSGAVFSDIGDSNPNNCTPMIAKHLIRMASTRAKGRCLRDMCNIGIACLEELSDLDDVMGSGSAKKTTRKPAAPKAKPKVAEKKTEEKKPETEKASKPAQKVNSKSTNTKATKPKVSKQEQGTPSFSEAQKRAIYNLSRRRGISVESLDNLVMEDYGKTLDDLSSAEASDLIRSLQQAA